MFDAFSGSCCEMSHAFLSAERVPESRVRVGFVELNSNRGPFFTETSWELIELEGVNHSPMVFLEKHRYGKPNAVQFDMPAVPKVPK
jgi:hypothetical protein